MKIFLASNDRTDYSVVASAVGYPYRLCSYFYLRQAGEWKTRDLMMAQVEQASESEWIMDSGLFSFMFGSEQGKLNGFADYHAYATKYLSDVKQWGWKHAIVECDAQRVLGVAETHRLRDEIFRPSGMDVIYVWHIPEGEDGLAKLAREEKRIAISIPELRQVIAGGAFGGGDSVKKAMLHCLNIVRKSGGNPRVHLLGNTERGLIDAPGDSCDSTTWMSGGRFGSGIYYEARTQCVMNASIYSPKFKAWRKWCEREFAPSFELMANFWPKPSQFVYYGNAACGAIAMLIQMEKLNRTNCRLAIPDRLIDPHGTAKSAPEQETEESRGT